jgi:hypothetical protein
MVAWEQQVNGGPRSVRTGPTMDELIPDELERKELALKINSRPKAPNAVVLDHPAEIKKRKGITLAGWRVGNARALAAAVGGRYVAIKRTHLVADGNRAGEGGSLVP